MKPEETAQLNQLNRKSLLPFMFVVFAAASIFFLTFQSQPDTSEISRKFQRLLMSFYGKGNIPAWVKNMTFLRTFAHVPLYFFLSVSAYSSFWLYGVKFRRSLMISLLLSVCVGLFDEMIKIFIPGREFDIVDWTFDIAGIIAGLCAVILVRLIFIMTEGRMKHA